MLKDFPGVNAPGAFFYPIPIIISDCHPGIWRRLILRSTVVNLQTQRGALQAHAQAYRLRDLPGPEVPWRH